jgi:uncharacterized protein YeaO (DUF488 family)
MIKTKSVYDPVEESDGFRILIMRKWPRGIGYRKNNKRGMIDFWCKELGPSIDLLDNWNGKKITWSQYVKQYRAEQKSSAAAKKETNCLAVQSVDKTVTLLCKERENDPHCHRHILKKIIHLKQND